MESNKASIFYTIDDIVTIVHAFNPVKLEDVILNADSDHNKLYHLHEFLTYYSYRTKAVDAVEEFRRIINSNNCLDNEGVRIWVEGNIPFFKEHLFSFGYTYTDEDGNLDKDFYLPDYSIFIDRTAYIPIIQYWLLMKNLYFGEYYKKREDRSPIEAADPKDYYYVEPDHDAPTDIEIARNILALK